MGGTNPKIPRVLSFALCSIWYITEGNSLTRSFHSFRLARGASRQLPTLTSRRIPSFIVNGSSQAIRTIVKVSSSVTQHYILRRHLVMMAPGNGEDILGGRIEYDQLLVNPKFVDTFADAAVAVKPRITGYRTGLFSLVTGPSGSGKTLFALKKLASMIFTRAPKDGKEIYIVHVEAKQIITTNATAADLKSNLTKYVRAKIESHKFNASFAFNLYLLVVIDDVGPYAGIYFDNEDKIRALEGFLEDNLWYKFTKGMHLTLVGTGLEVPIRVEASGSQPHRINFRMQPWSLQNFGVMVDASKHAKAAVIEETVANFGVFQCLASNARCAYYLMDSLASELPSWSSMNKSVPFRNCVDGIVSKVADQYIGSNGLATLETDTEKIQVARAVFREITKANKRPQLIFFPNFDDLPAKNRGVAYSLLDVHVESYSGELNFVDDNSNSVSMTPAFAVVLAELFDENGCISWGWRGMESIVVLGELKIVIQNMSDDGLLGGLLRSAFAIPELGATEDFVVPVVGNSLVVINGENAPYADVIAPFRLVQANFSDDREEHCKINLYEEVSKMGLTTAVNEYRLNQAVTSVFHCLWKNEQERVEYSSAMSPRDDDTIHQSNLYGPFQTLVWEAETRYPKIDCHFDNTTNLVTIETQGKWLPRQIPALVDFDDQPVTAVFVTDCQSFELQKDVTITRDDVEWDGKLTGAKAEEVAGLVPDLRKNVEFQFLLL